MAETNVVVVPMQSLIPPKKKKTDRRRKTRRSRYRAVLLLQIGQSPNSFSVSVFFSICIEDFLTLLTDPDGRWRSSTDVLEESATSVIVEEIRQRLHQAITVDIGDWKTHRKAVTLKKERCGFPADVPLYEADGRAKVPTITTDFL